MLPANLHASSYYYYYYYALKCVDIQTFYKTSLIQACWLLMPLCLHTLLIYLKPSLVSSIRRVELGRNCILTIIWPSQICYKANVNFYQWQWTSDCLVNSFWHATFSVTLFQTTLPTSILSTKRYILYIYIYKKKTQKKNTWVSKKSCTSLLEN